MKYVQRLISDSHSESISPFNDIFVTGQVNTKKGLTFSAITFIVSNFHSWFI